MKNLLFGLIAIVMFSGFSFAQSLEESAIITTGNRVFTREGGATKSARSFTIKSYDKYKLLNQYTINSEGFTDDGRYNDLKAGDGIYTSTVLLPNLAKDVNPANKLFVSDLFAYTAQASSTSKIKVSCKMRITHSGSSWFGNSCASGCIELYDCEVSIEW